MIAIICVRILRFINEHELLQRVADLHRIRFAKHAIVDVLLVYGGCDERVRAGQLCVLANESTESASVIISAAAQSVSRHRQNK